jgi:hypothetical protein
MAISLTQTPNSPSLTQSPVIYTVFETGNEITSESFQYILDLTYYRGDATDISSLGTHYILEKYPNESGRGIFDVGRILNSTFQTTAEQLGPETVFFQANIYGRWLEGNTFVTSSSQITSGVSVGLDGYQLFNEQINPNIELNTLNEYPYYQILTDGPTSQSFQEGTFGNMNVFVNTLSGINPIDNIEYNSNLGIVSYPLTASYNSFTTIQDFPIGPSEATFPYGSTPEWFSVQAKSGSVTLGDSIRFEKKCPTKYETIRVKWKNRWGAFDWFNFDLVSRQSFQTQTTQYQPQIGTWGGTSLTYNYYDASKQNYATDVIQTLSVNTDYVNEDYNKIFQQLLVSDEIYFIDNTSQDYSFLRPLTIKSSSVQFKTQKVDKLIQYQFEFEYAQGYKLQF